MPQLQLPEWIGARLINVTPRQECHGDDHVVALTMRFRLSGPNTLLDLVSPTLRRGIFAGVDGQEVLPGIPEPTPNLRAKELEGLRIAIPGVKTEGATLFVDHGIEGDVQPLSMGDCKVDKVTGAGYDGGSGDVEFNVGTSDIDSEELGIICGKLGSEFPIKVIAPKEQPRVVATDAEADPNQPTLDGTTGSEIGEPSAARQTADAAFHGDATDAFTADVAENGLEPTAKTPAQIKREARFPSAAAKYRDPESQQTWSGRGLKPKWLTEALANGKSLADFEATAA